MCKPTWFGFHHLVIKWQTFRFWLPFIVQVLPCTIIFYMYCHWHVYCTCTAMHLLPYTCTDIYMYIFRECEARTSRTESVCRPSSVLPSFRRPSVFLPRFFLKIDYPTCHVTAGAVKTGLCVNQWMFVLFKSTNSTKCTDVTVQLYISAQTT